MKLFILVLFVAVSVSGCSLERTGLRVDVAPRDAGHVDGSIGDAGAFDSSQGRVDAGGIDASGIDASGIDASGIDAGGIDAGGVDAGSPDTSGVDAGSLDAGYDSAIPTDGDLRTRDYMGRAVLEVYHSGEWRGVCERRFDSDAAEVACRQLGGTVMSFDTSVDGPSEDFWLDNVNCKGSESRLEDCKHDAWGREDCDEDEHVELYCST